jgi:hypothetical protein
MCKKAQYFVADHVERSDNTESDSTNCHVRAMGETVCRQPLIADIWVHSHTTLRGMCGGHSGTAIFFFLRVPRLPLSASFC